MTKIRVLFLCFLGVCLSGYAQNDTIRQLKAVEIESTSQNKTVQATHSIQMLDKNQIKSLPVFQLSDALKFLSGVTIKDYGGVGGMKTIAVRGFGAQHTAVSYDGIAVTDCQTGQIDLGKLFLDQVETISLENGTASIFMPAQLYASANLVQVKSQMPVFKADRPVNLRVEFKGGSFMFLNPSFVMENRWLSPQKNPDVRLASALSVNYLYTKGNYPYTRYYGTRNDSTSREIRDNSDIQTFSAQADIYAILKKQATLNFKGYYYGAERGLPGAIILYNTDNKARLRDQEIFGQLHYQQPFHSKVDYQLNAKMNYAYQRYTDPDYLNAEGFLENRYIQRTAYLSQAVLYKPFKIWQVSLSNDLTYQNMSSNMLNFVQPQRLSVLTLLSTRLVGAHIEASGGLLYHCILNQVKINQSGKNIHKVTPSISLTIKPLIDVDFNIVLFYKNIFRLPSFNDLYYRDIGNVDLKPETTHQLNLGFHYGHFFPRQNLNFRLSVDGYYNIVKDKIVAIPTKNLFLWSMYNFGRVEIAGLDINLNIVYPIIPVLKIELSGNYSYQYAVDKTQKLSKTYQHQIPYTPAHSGSFCFALKMKWVDLSYTFLATGVRYALPQNIAANRLDPYVDQSLSVSKDFYFKKWGFGLKAELLNLANVQYEIVKNYPMQGRSFRITTYFSLK